MGKIRWVLNLVFSACIGIAAYQGKITTTEMVLAFIWIDMMCLGADIRTLLKYIAKRS